MTEAETASSPGEDTALWSRPGFLIRRLHQIHLALFMEECAAFGVTPVQYSIMSVALAQPGLEQGRLGHEIGVDRATLANVVARLEARGLLVRASSSADKRLKLVRLTEAGAALLREMEPCARRAHDRTVEALAPQSRTAFLLALGLLVQTGNDYGRAPLRLA